MNHRDQLIQNKEFWMRLEYIFSGWLQESDDKELRQYWCDGISPSKATNTKLGIGRNCHTVLDIGRPTASHEEDIVVFGYEQCDSRLA